MGDRFHLPSVAGILLPVALCILTLLPHGLLGTIAKEDNAGGSVPLQRVKRGWVWNQFFVLEEYTGLEPLYIGKVSDDTLYMHVCARWGGEAKTNAASYSRVALVHT